MEVRERNRLLPLAIYAGGLVLMFLGERVFTTINAARKTISPRSWCKLDSLNSKPCHLTKNGRSQMSDHRLQFQRRPMRLRLTVRHD